MYARTHVSLPAKTIQGNLPANWRSELPIVCTHSSRHISSIPCSMGVALSALLPPIYFGMPPLFMSVFEKKISRDIWSQVTIDLLVSRLVYLTSEYETRLQAATSPWPWRLKTFFCYANLVGISCRIHRSVYFCNWCLTFCDIWPWKKNNASRLFTTLWHIA